MHIDIIRNPNANGAADASDGAGQRGDLAAALDAIAALDRAVLHETDGPGHATRIAEDVARAASDRDAATLLLVAGGDGTAVVVGQMAPGLDGLERPETRAHDEAVVGFDAVTVHDLEPLRLTLCQRLQACLGAAEVGYETIKENVISNHLSCLLSGL